MDHYNCHMHPQSNFVNASINHSSHHQAEQSLQRESNKQPPQKNFIRRKTNMNKTEKAKSRLFADSIASMNNSMNLNVYTATEKGITVQSQLRQKEKCFNHILIVRLVIFHICHSYEQSLAEGSGSLTQNKNVCVTTNSNHVEQRHVICILFHGFLLFPFKLFYIFFIFIKQFQNLAVTLVTTINKDLNNKIR